MRRALSTTLASQSVGLSRFMSRVYTHMGLGVTSSVTVSLFLGDIVATNPGSTLGCFGVGCVAAFSGVYGIGKLRPVFKQKTESKAIIEYAEDVPLRKASFWTLTAGMGLVMAPMMGIISQTDPAIIPASLLMSAGIFGGCAVAAAKAKNADIMQWKAPLSVGLVALIGTQLSGIAASLIFGDNSFSAIVHSVDIYGGIGLFTLMSIYDAHAARQMYLKGEPDHLGCATSVYLDFMNILIRVMEAMAKAKQNKD